MSKYTTNLNLYEVDPTVDGAITFNIKTMLNDNWDKIDAAVASKETPTGSQAKADSAQAAAEAYVDAKFPVSSSELAAKAITTSLLANPPMFSLPNLLHPSAQQFTRGSNASRKNLAPVPYNVLRYEQGKFGLGAFVEEAGGNSVYNSDMETITGTAQLFNDTLTSYTGSSAAPWTVQAGGSFTFGASGATSGALASFMTAGNAAWKPLVGSNGNTLALAVQATFTTQSTVSGDAGAVFLWQDSSNYYYANLAPGQFNLGKRVAGGALTNIATVGQTISASTAYTIQLIRYSNGNLTANLYSGVGTGGTLLQQLLATDTSLTGGFLIGVGGDTGVIIKNASVTGPWADGWSISGAGDLRVAWSLTATNPISGAYSLSAVGFSGTTGGFVTPSAEIPATVGNNYTASASLNTSAVGANGAHISLNYRNASMGVLFGPSSSSIVGTTNTQRIALSPSQPAPTNTTQMDIVLVMNDSGTAVFDAIQLEQKAYATTYVRNDSTSATASRSADSLSYNLSKQLPVSFFGAFVWMPELASSVSPSSGNSARRILEIYDNTGTIVEYILQYDYTNHWFRFLKTGENYATINTAFNAGDTITLFVMDDPVTTGKLSLWVGINGGSPIKASVASALQIKNCQSLYVGCSKATIAEVTGTLDFPILTSQIPTDEQVNALYYSAEWGGVRDYPGALPDKVAIGRNTSLQDFATNYFQIINRSNGVILSSPNSTYITSNCFYDAANAVWQRFDTTKQATVIFPDATGGHILSAPAGPNPISWTVSNVLQALSGGYKIQSGSTGLQSLSNGNNTITINFPSSFSNNNYVLAGLNFIAPSQTQGLAVAVTSKAIGSITLTVYSPISQSAYLDWTVIGS